MVWRINGGFFDAPWIDLEIIEADLFKNRYTENFEVRIWDELRKDWSDTYPINAYGDGYLHVYPQYTGPWPPNEGYYKIAATKARVQVKIL
jgi:hypothetical protein